eukprot:g7853.t1
MASHSHHPMENEKPAGFSQIQDRSGRDSHHAVRGSTAGDANNAEHDAVEVRSRAAAAPTAREEVNEVGRTSCVGVGGGGGGGSRGGLVGAFLALLAEGISSCCDLRDALGRTALHEAAEQGDSDVAKILLNAGASVDPRCRRMITPLMLASRRGHGGVVRLLLRAGAGGTDRQDDEWTRVEWRSTALHHAARGGHADVVSILLDAGFYRDQHDEAGLTPVEISARAGSASSPATTRSLLCAGGGGGGGGGGERGGKLVHDYVNMAAEDVDIVRGLADGGAFLDWQDETGGETALHRAAHFQHSHVANVLIGAGADVNLRNVRGASPLHVAASTGCVRIMAALLRAGADREARMGNGRSPLHLAVINNKPGAVLLLLRAGASTEHRDLQRGQTPLSEASEYALAPIIRLLVQAGADVQSRSKPGLTVLHWACRFNSPDSVAVLLSAGADPDAAEQAEAAASAGAEGTTSLSPPQSPLSMGARRLKAEDVIGFGDPSRRAEDPRRPFMGELRAAAERRLDPVAHSRIAQLLREAKKDRAWRRRGWLVLLLVKRRDEGVRASPGEKTPSAPGVGVESESPAPSDAGAREVNVSEDPKTARVGVHAPPRKSQRVGGGNNRSPTVPVPPKNSLEGARNEPQLVDAGGGGGGVGVGADRVGAPFSTKLQAEMEAGGGNRLLVSTAVVEALLELASVEAGVFRSVVSYV